MSAFLQNYLKKAGNRDSISKIRSYLFLTSYGCLTEEKINELGITHAIDATNLSNIEKWDGIEYFTVLINDTEASNIKKYFESAVEFIRKAKESGGKIIVYCAQGISRSASIVIVYLMTQYNQTLKNAHCDVHSVRSIISPNPGFWRQMIEYEQEIKGETSAFLTDNKICFKNSFTS